MADHGPGEAAAREGDDGAAGPVLHRRHLPAALLLLGSFAFGYNAATFVHELGHALAALATGTAVEAIHIHPFTWSSTSYVTAPEHPMLVAAAGVIFSLAVSLFLIAAGWSWWSPWAELLSLTAICGIIDSGIYLAVDGLMQGGGDATELVLMGVPLGVLVGAGLVLAAAGTAVAMVRPYRLGLAPEDGVRARLFVLEVGIGPYLLAMLAWHAASNRDEIGLWLVYVTIGAALLAAMAIGSRVVQTRVAWVRHQPVVRPTWPAAVATLVLGAAVVAWGLVA